jgi:sugar phosphate isomerase/epimerase
MKRISMNELTTYRWTFEEDVQQYAEAGISAISVWRDKLTDFGEERGIELIGDSGLCVSALLWAGGFTGSEGRTFRESVQDAKEALQLAAALNTRCLIVYSGARGGHTHNHARRLLRSAISEILPLADEFGVALALEPMHPGCAAEWTFLTDLKDAL